MIVILIAMLEETKVSNEEQVDLNNVALEAHYKGTLEAWLHKLIYQMTLTGKQGCNKHTFLEQLHSSRHELFIHPQIWQTKNT